MITGVHTFLIIASVVLAGYAVIDARFRSILGWAVLLLALAFLVR